MDVCYFDLNCFIHCYVNKGLFMHNSSQLMNIVINHCISSRLFRVKETWAIVDTGTWFQVKPFLRN